MYLLIQEQKEGKFGLQALRRVSLRAPCAHRTLRAGSELDSFASLSFCKFKLRFLFVPSGAGGCEVEFALVLLSVKIHVPPHFQWA